MLDDAMIHESRFIQILPLVFYLHYYAHMICCYGTILGDFCENIAIQMIKFNEFNLQKLNLNSQFHNNELKVLNL